MDDLNPKGAVHVQAGLDSNKAAESAKLNAKITAVERWHHICTSWKAR